MTVKSVLAVAAAAAMLVPMTTLAKDGDWTGGGGRLVQDANNPWFLDNTKQFTYCIVHDADNFSASYEQVRSAVSDAIEYWRKEFESAFYIPLSTGVTVKIKPESLVETLCDEDKTQLFLQFGHLTDEQLSKIDDVRRYIGLTIRTKYDRKNLVGKGFIYIGADKGALSFRATQDMIEQPWKNPGLLQKVLVHEFGHVFGISHGDSNREINSEIYPETVLQKRYGEYYKDLTTLMPFFSQKPTVKNNPKLDIASNERWPGHLFDFLNLPPEIKALRFVNQDTVAEVQVSTGSRADLKRIGEIKFTKFSSGNMKSPVSVMISREYFENNSSRPYPIPDDVAARQLPLVLQTFANAIGVYTSDDKTVTRPLFLQHRGDHVAPQIIGEKDGEIFPNLISGFFVN